MEELSPNFNRTSRTPVLGRYTLRVMLRMSTNDDRTAAVLHDVVEDTDWSLELLKAEGFSEPILRAIDSLTRREDETYEEFVARAGRDPIGRRVKLADLEDNSDLARIACPTETDRARLERYRRAIEELRKLEATDAP